MSNDSTVCCHQFTIESSPPQMAASRESIVGFVFIGSPTITVIIQVRGTIDGTAPQFHQLICSITYAYSLLTSMFIGDHMAASC